MKQLMIKIKLKIDREINQLPVQQLANMDLVQYFRERKVQLIRDHNEGRVKL